MNDHPNAPGADAPYRDDSPQHDFRRSSGQEVLAPFGAPPIAAPSSSLLHVDHAQMEFARRYPRNLDLVRKRMAALAMHTEASATACVYALPRAEKPIIGPSINFAMIVWSAYGNCLAVGDFKEIIYKSKQIVCVGEFCDFETNNVLKASATRRASRKNGSIYDDDMLNVVSQATTSVAIRNVILKAVPQVLWWPIYEQCKIIMRGTAETLTENRSKMIAAFAQFGVKPDTIFKAFGVRNEKEISLDHIGTLRGMYQQLRDEVITAEDMFDPKYMTGQYDDAVIENPLGADDRDRRPINRTTTNGPSAQRQDTPRGHTAEETRQGGAREAAGAGAPSGGGKPDSAQGPQMAGGTGQAEQQSTAAPAAAAGVATTTVSAEGAGGGAEANGAITTVEQYTAYLADWLERATSATAIDQRYRSERDIRKNLIDMDTAAKAAIEQMKAAAEAKFGEGT